MRINKKITSMLDLPKEVTLDYPKITIIGDESIVVENHKGLIELSQTVIRLNTKIFILKICGENLDIKSISEDEIEIVGRITGTIMS
ncbi:MAG: sporulation protein YqfC [Clostridia bacterium]|nr:sporulation protein YqfC [Clostridia bacterium]